MVFLLIQETLLLLQIKKKYYVISEFMSNSVPLQTALITHCQKRANGKKFTKQQWHQIFIKLFLALTIMKENFFNHCDLHGDNIFIKEPLALKFIDFDTGRHTKLYTNVEGHIDRVEICSGFISTHAGTSTNVGKSNDLRKACGLKFSKTVIKGVPIGPQLALRIKQSDGQWFHFYHFLKSYFSHELNAPDNPIEKKDKIRTLLAAVKFAIKGLSAIKINQKLREGRRRDLAKPLNL